MQARSNHAEMCIKWEDMTTVLIAMGLCDALLTADLRFPFLLLPSL